MKITRNGYIITDENGVVLPINRQMTKEQGDPEKAWTFAVIKVENLEGSNGAKWLSLSKVPDGETIDLKDVCVSRPHSGGIATLTEEEKKQIEELESQIREIKEKARARKPKDPKTMTPEEIMIWLTQKFGKEEADKMIEIARERVKK